MSKVIIIGGGPAGISAALYTLRAGIETLIISKDYGSLGKAEKIENYYGLEQPVSGKNLVETGISQAIGLGAIVIKEEAIGFGYEEKFVVTTTKNKYEADGVIIATGSPRKAPKIKGISEFEGSGVSYCAVCDAFFFRGKNVCVLGNGEYALSEAKELLPVVNSVTILTNGETLKEATHPGALSAVEILKNKGAAIQIIDDKVLEIAGDIKVNRVIFENENQLEIEGVFIAYGSAGSADLARKMGADVAGNRIVVDENMATTLPGLFAAGDCTGGMLQIAKAVYEGAKAGTSAIQFLRTL